MRAQMLRKETGTLREETEGMSRSGGGGKAGKAEGGGTETGWERV
jgi:hypothetical protein